MPQVITLRLYQKFQIDQGEATVRRQGWQGMRSKPMRQCLNATMNSELITFTRLLRRVKTNPLKRMRTNKRMGTQQKIRRKENEIYDYYEPT